MATTPSIAMIPSGYKANKVYSVLPTDGSGDLDFARTTKATRVNSDGSIEEVAIGVPRLDYADGGCPSLLLEPSSTNLITQSESFGNSYWTKSGASIQGDASTAGSEQVTNGDFAADTDWTKQSSWTISGGSATYDFVSNSNYLRQTLLDGGFVLGKTYKIDFEITSGTAYININSNGGSLVSADTYGVGSHSVQAYASSNGSDILIYGRNTQGTAFSIDNVSVKEVSGFSAPSVDSPLGAFKLVEDTSTAVHYIRRILSNTLNTPYTYSCRVKGGEGNYLRLQENSLTGAGVFIDFVNKTATPIQGNASNLMTTVATITELADSYFDVSFTYEPNATGNYNFYTYLMPDATNSTISYTGDGTSGVYIFGAQVEQQSSATSYIKTSGTTISRTADSASKSGISSLINSSQGVVYAEISALSDNGTNRVFSISDGTNDNRIVFGYRSISKQFFARLEANNSSAVDLTFIMSDPREISKVAILWDSSFNYKMYSNGILQDSSTGSDSFIGLDRFEFSNPIGIENFYGNCKDLRVYNQILSDAELTTLTTI